jgi:hypothetical protein
MDLQLFEFGGGLLYAFIIACQSALQPWVILGLLYNQSPLLSYPSSSFHPFTSIFFKSLSTSSNHLILDLRHCITFHSFNMP